MLFNSLVFLVFFTIVLLLYPRLKLKQQNIMLLLASYVFYGYWDWRFNFLLLASTIVDFFVGKRLQRSVSPAKRQQLLALSVCVNLGILGAFKYFNFFVGSAATLLESLGLHANLPVLQIVLPVGISFYTFQTMSYTIDIYRRRMQPVDSFIDFALFVSFFPQLVAGPIERARHLLPQISRPRVVDRALVLRGLNLMLLGYFKKVAIADSLAPVVDRAFGETALLSSGELLTGLYAFAIQIYGDFSGYTDIARGVACLLGFDLMENFNAPYLSRNITEFWRRWHISLSTWLRDYLYISLGGNRRGRRRTYINLFITMFLGGLWHGAAWTFVVWGSMHGIYLAVHKLLLGDRKTDSSRPRSRWRYVLDLLKIALTFHLVCLTWIFFRAADFPAAFQYLSGILRLEDIGQLGGTVLFAAGTMLVLDIVQTSTGSHTWLVASPIPIRLVVSQILLISVLAAAIYHMHTITPFIYFQF